jgi:hypothetical protein
MPLKHRLLFVKKYVRRIKKLPNNDLYGEPGVADALNIEESVVCVRTVLVQRPRCLVSASPHCDVPGGQSVTLIKKKIKFSSYLGKFRMEQLQSHI